MSLGHSDPFQPILLGPDGGEARWWGDSLAIIKASAETSAGRIAVIDNYGVEGAAPPLHVHHNEGEGFYVIDGMLTIWVGGKPSTRQPAHSCTGRHTFRIPLWFGHRLPATCS
jgi:mannose-6-phosphate isomerase-like protein (cupin superfamily)